MGTIWSADKFLPNAQNCQVWNWSSDLTNYFCQWEIQEGESQAKASYQKGAKIIKQCLGNAWKATTTKTHSGGEHTLFSKQDIPTIVSIRYFKEQRSWFEHWTNTIVVGDKDNLNAPAQ